MTRHPDYLTDDDGRTVVAHRPGWLELLRDGVTALTTALVGIMGGVLLVAMLTSCNSPSELVCTEGRGGFVSCQRFPAPLEP